MKLIKLLPLLLLWSDVGAQQWIGRKSYLFSATQTTAGGSVVQTVDVKSPKFLMRATVETKDDHVLITPKGNSFKNRHNYRLTDKDVDQGKSGRSLRYVALTGSQYHKQPNFRYYEGKLILQPITIALKMRDEVLQDTIPNQVTSGFNVGFAFGYKIEKIFWQPNKNAFNSNTWRYHFTLAPIFNIGAVELTDKNTRDPKLEFPRSIPILSFGLMAAVGVNGLTLGISKGQDNTFTKASDGWVYDRKPWWGIIVGLDLIK